MFNPNFCTCDEDEGPACSQHSKPTKGTTAAADLDLFDDPKDQKIIVLGDPHSGKSCFISALISHLPDFQWTEVCPDGEGPVFHALAAVDMESAKTFKANRKGQFTWDYALTTAAMVAQLQGNHLLDAGGRRTEMNAFIARQATAAVILYKSEESKAEWLEWCSSLGLPVIHTVKSNMDGEDHPEAISGLARGKTDTHKPAVKSAAVACKG